MSMRAVRTRARTTIAVRRAERITALLRLLHEQRPRTTRDLAVAMGKRWPHLIVRVSCSRRAMGMGSTLASTLQAMTRQGWIKRTPLAAGCAGWDLTHEGVLEHRRRTGVTR